MRSPLGKHSRCQWEREGSFSRDSKEGGLLSGHLAQLVLKPQTSDSPGHPPPFSFPKLHPISKPSGHLAHTSRALYTSNPLLFFPALATFIPPVGDRNSTLIGSLLPLPLLAIHSLLASRLICSVHESNGVRGFPVTSVSPEEEESSPQQRWTDIYHLLTAAALASTLLSSFVCFAPATAPPALPR